MRLENIANTVVYGGRTWARTKDPLIKSQLLYQLSYASESRRSGEARGGATAAGGGRLAA